MIGRVWIHEAAHRLHARHHRADEDRRHHSKPREPFRPPALQQERDAERHGGECVAAVVDQVREQRHASRQREHHRLRRRGDAEHRERDAHRTQPLARALDRVVHEPVAMPMPIRMGVPVGVFMLDMRATHDPDDGTQPGLGPHRRHTQAW